MIKNIIALIAFNIILFVLHHYFVTFFLKPQTSPALNLGFSYLINAMASLGMCIAILFLKKNFETQIGFIFLGLSIFKMILLFLLLNPTNNIGHVTTIDAFAFFIPFGLNLVTEQIFIVKLLKISDLKE